MSKLTILPVVNQENPAYDGIDIDEALPQFPQLILQVAPIKAGKTVRTANLFFNENFYRDTLDHTYVFSPTMFADPINQAYMKDDDFSTFDEYDDNIVRKIVANQMEKPKEDRPLIGFIFDDLIGYLKDNAFAFKLATKFRHYNIGLMIFNTQSLRSVPPILRNNATTVILSHFSNEKENKKIMEEYSEFFGGEKIFANKYHGTLGSSERYDFLVLRLDENPAVMEHGFGNVIHTGGGNYTMDGGEEPQ
tara:strand:- start:536 stop:1282 length:747 start_codon:yes stop_codon:yes gene_type:complete